MTATPDRIAPPSEEQMLDFANDALEPVERIALARLLSRLPEAAARTLGHVADRDELLLALGVAGRRSQDPTLPPPLPETGHRPQRAPRRKVGFGLAGVALASACGLWLVLGPSARPVIDDALRANDVAQLRLEMASMDEDPVVDRAEVLKLAGLALPDRLTGWRLLDTQVLASDAGASVVMSFDAGVDGLVTLYVAPGSSAPVTPSDITLPEGRAAWFRHGGTDYVLIGRTAHDPLDDEAQRLKATFLDV